MHRYLASIGFRPEEAGALGYDVRQAGRRVEQHPQLPALRIAEVGSDLALLAREEGGPAWPALQTRWRTEFLLEALHPMPGGHAVATGQWEPIPGEILPATVHVNSLVDRLPWTLQPRSYAAYLGLLAVGVAERAPSSPYLQAHSGPAPSPAGQCRLTVRGKVSYVYTVQNERTGQPITQVWITSPGSWALLVTAAPESVHGECQAGSWVEASGLLQGDLVWSERA